MTFYVKRTFYKFSINFEIDRCTDCLYYILHDRPIGLLLQEEANLHKVQIILGAHQASFRRGN